MYVTVVIEGSSGVTANIMARLVRLGYLPLVRQKATT